MKFLKILPLLVLFSCGQAFSQTYQTDFVDSPSGLISAAIKFAAGVPDPSTYGVIGAVFLFGLVYSRRKKLSGLI